jgi:hypothetical protein
MTAARVYYGKQMAFFWHSEMSCSPVIEVHMTGQI